MSRTKHHKNQRSNKWGLDFGAKYNCDKGYRGCHGHFAKLLANKERRNKSKKIIVFEIDTINSNSFCSLI